MKIDTLTARRRLVNRREPYFATIVRGRSLGFRRFQDDVGHWIARVRSKVGKYEYRPLGTDTALDYAQALASAQEWFERQAVAEGEDHRSVTVETAVNDYLDFLERNGKPSTLESARARARKYVVPKLGDTLLADLTPLQVRNWHQGLVRKTKDADKRRASQASANRCLSILKTALTRAAFGRKGIDTAAWMSVKLFPKTATSRAVFWSKAEGL